MIDPAKEYVTRGGNKVRHLHIQPEPDRKEYQVTGQIETLLGWEMAYWTADGRNVDCHLTSQRDLIPAPEEDWRVVYGGRDVGGQSYPSKDRAIAALPAHVRHPSHVIRVDKNFWERRDDSRDD